MSFLLPKSERSAFTGRLMETWRVIAPRRLLDGESSFSIVDSADQVDWDYRNDHYPPKRFLFPPTEKLFEYGTGEKVTIVENEIEPARTLLFCVRSCDASGIAYLDRFFLDGFEDTPYSARRRRTAIVTLACTHPFDGCFCSSCSCGPALDDGFDLQLTDTGRDYLVQVGSETGTRMIDLAMDILTPAGEDHERKAAVIMAAAREEFEIQPRMDVAVDAVTQREVFSVIEELAKNCFQCTGCTNLCPTCTCFDTTELCTDRNRYSRVRCWDSCQLAGFTREAGDRNPRPDAAARLNRWYFHKLSRQYIEINGRIGCVGCGRCDKTCLGDLQMLSFLKKVGAL